MKETLLVLLLAAGAASAATKAKTMVRPADAVRADNANYRISFNMRAGKLESAGNFVAAQGTQGNYFYGDGAAAAKNAQPKKWGTTANCVPYLLAGGPLVRLECQFELSGEETALQLQNTFTAELGKEIVLIDETDRRLAVKVVALAGAKKDQ